MKKRRGENADSPSKNSRQRLSQILDVPLDVIADVPRFVMNDNSELTVENYKSIEGYEPTEVVLRSKTYRIHIQGENLQIIAITDDEILIRGQIKTLSLGT